MVSRKSPISWTTAAAAPVRVGRSASRASAWGCTSATLTRPLGCFACCKVARCPGTSKPASAPAGRGWRPCSREGRDRASRAGQCGYFPPRSTLMAKRQTYELTPAETDRFEKLRLEYREGYAINFWKDVADDRGLEPGTVLALIQRGVLWPYKFTGLPKGWRRA